MKSGWTLLGFCAAACVSVGQPPLRVACVGDSITYGADLPDRERDSYPSVLARLSAGRLVTGNFGVSGATALQTPFQAWTDTRAAREALAFVPDMVVIMLGINDLAHPGLHDRYPDDLRDIVHRFQALRPEPRIFLCTLTPIAPADHQLQANRLIQHTMNPAIRAVAAQTGAHLVDIHAAFPNRLDLLPDGLHPNARGAELIARTVLAALEAVLAPAPPVQPAPLTGPPDLSIRQEAVAARFRAEQWLQHQPAAEDLRDPLAALEEISPRTPEDIADLLPLLDGREPAPGEELFFRYALLAAALDRIGHETVFVDADRPRVWREALLHQIVQRQRIDAAGGGFWTEALAEDPAAALRATTYALQALTLALGVSP